MKPMRFGRQSINRLVARSADTSIKDSAPWDATASTVDEDFDTITIAEEGNFVRSCSDGRSKIELSLRDWAY